MSIVIVNFIVCEGYEPIRNKNLRTLIHYSKQQKPEGKEII